jgi:hypothetical protein
LLAKLGGFLFAQPRLANSDLFSLWRFDALMCHWQLQHRSLLALLQERQENDAPVWKFQRVVMGRREFFVDLSEDRSVMLYNTAAPGPETLTPDFVREGQFCTRR